MIAGEPELLNALAQASACRACGGVEAEGAQDLGKRSRSGEHLAQALIVDLYPSSAPGAVAGPHAPSTPVGGIQPKVDDVFLETPPCGAADDQPQTSEHIVEAVRSRNRVSQLLVRPPAVPGSSHRQVCRVESELRCAEPESGQPGTATTAKTKAPTHLAP